VKRIGYNVAKLVRRLWPQTWWGRVYCATFVLIVIGVFSFISFRVWNEYRAYALSSTELKLLGTNDSKLESKLSYDAAQKQFNFNMKAIQSPGQLQSSLHKSIGAGDPNAPQYALQLPTNPAKGFEYYDVNTQLGFSMTPTAASKVGKLVDEHIVYPLSSGVQAVYTLKDNGLKEDILMPKYIGNSISYGYTLQLPGSLEARALNDGSGAIGIYSADPTLANATADDSSDELLLQSAQTNAQKNYLLFEIPAPVIKQSNGQLSKAQATYSLTGSTLTVHITGLDKATYPLSVDPSVAVATTAQFAAGGADDNNISLGTNQISRSSLSGGSIDQGGSWTATTSFTTAREKMMSVVYDNYLYVMGGDAGSTPFTDVQYAAITGTNGAVSGSWGTTTVLPVALTGASAVAYDGYMYVIGGYTGSATPGSVYYAPINANGTLGSWTATSSMYAAESSGAATVYNGYLYYLGGVATPGTGGVTTVQYAAIEGNGALNTWATDTAFTTGRQSEVATASNGFIYIAGGTNGTTYYADVQYAIINADGTLGSTWTTTTALTGTSYKGSFGGIFDGYFYIMGGTNGTATNAVYYSEVNANGALQAWRTTTSFNTPARAFLGGGFNTYNGTSYAYILGGYTGSVYQADVQVAPIDPEGENTPFTAQFANAQTGSTTANLATADYGVAMANFDGETYAIGGCKTYSSGCTASDTSTEYEGLTSTVSTNHDGVPSGWSAGPALNHARYLGCATGYNGYVYMLGGASSGTTATNYAEYASYNLTSGDLGAWTNSTNTFTTSRYALGCATYNGYIYAFGGMSGTTYYATCEYQSLTSTGTITSGTWSSCGSLPVSLSNFGYAIYGSTIYVAGGTTTGGTKSSAIYIGTMSSTGGITWTTSATTLPTGIQNPGLAVSNGVLYRAGGTDSTGARTDMQYDTITATSDLSGSGTSGWNSGQALPNSNSYFGLIALSTTLIEAGGLSGSTPQNTAYYSLTNNGGDGITPTGVPWSSETSTGFTAMYDMTSTVYNGYLYTAGGFTNTTGASVATIFYTKLNGDGTNSTWATTTLAMPTNRVATAITAYNGYLYLIGGCSAVTISSGQVCSGTLYNTVLYAPISSTGNITAGSWATASNITTARWQGQVVEADGYFYLFGGVQAAANSYLADSQYAVVNSDGSLGSWTMTNSFTTARTNFGAIAYNGYVYILGGYNSSGSQNDVQYALINTSTGALGTFNYTTSFPYARNGPGVSVYNGYLYVVNGYSAGDLSDIQVAPIESNGQVGSWTSGGALGGMDSGAYATYNGYSYWFGGYCGSVCPNNAWSAPISLISRNAHYSALINLGTLFSLNSISITGSLPDAAGTVNYRTAGSNGIFSTTNNALYGLSNPISVACTTTLNTQYVFVFVDISDGVANAVYPDLSQSNVTNISLTYSNHHPPPNLRLRGGKSFQSGSLLPLDTCTS
jgi:hypothetical protein